MDDGRRKYRLGHQLKEYSNRYGEQLRPLNGDKEHPQYRIAEHEPGHHVAKCHTMVVMVVMDKWPWRWFSHTWEVNRAESTIAVPPVHLLWRPSSYKEQVVHR